MQSINLTAIEDAVRRSPKEKYGRRSKNISAALAEANGGQNHPFDVAQVRISPGKSLCPYHSHSAQWEFYLVVSGAGVIRDEDGEHAVGAGDTFIFAPNAAHQLTNRGAEDFVYLIVADNPPGDSCHYPDSGKWAVCQSGGEEVIIHGKAGDYFDGEE